jgi:hypothetical protein
MTSSAFDPANDELIIATPRKEIVFIEDNVADIDTLIKGIGSGKEVVILDSTVDGLHQIAQALAGRSGIDALHIISHGAAGSLNLGAVTLDAIGLEARHDELQAIGHSLREGGDILLYGCGVGADTGGEPGAGFVERFAIASGADVAASNNLTGASDLGGDWNLEITSGQVETAAVVNADTAALYHGVLAGIQNRTATFSTFTNFINPQHTVYDGAQADIVYKVDGLDAYRLVIDAPSTAVAAYEYANTYVNVAGQPPGGLIETSVNLSFQGGQVFNLTSLDVSKMGSPGGEHLVFTGVDKDNQVHTTSADITSGSAIPVTVNFTGFTDIKQLTITTTDNNGVFTFFSLDNIAFSDIQPPPPPAAPSAPDLDANYDKGVSSTDNLTNLTALKFTGTAGAGTTTVKLYDTDGTTEIGSAAVSSGTYTITTTGTLSNGTHTITAKAFDAFGNASSASSSLNVTVDTSAPTVTITSDLNALKIGETAAITFTFSEDPGATFTWNGSAGDVVVNGGTLSAIQGTGLTRTATFTPTANTNSGSASVSVNNGSFADAAGNVNTTGGSASLTFDTKAPTVSIASDKSTVNAGDTATATITFTFSEDPGASFTWNGSAGDVAVSGGTLSAISGTGLTRTATFTPAAGLDGVAASVTVGANSYADAAGNLGGAGASPSITVDTVAPSAPSTPALATSDDSGASNSDGITSKNSLTFSGTAEAGATVRLYDGATEVGHVTATGGNWTIPVAGLGEGSHTLTAVATDAAGNVGAASGGLAITVDRTAPSTTVASAAFSADTGASATDMVTKVAAQTISGTLSANLAAGEQVMVSLDNGATWSPATASAGSNAWELAATLAGSSTLKVKVVDLAGNDGAVYAHAYTLDQAAPAAPSTPDLDAGSDSGNSNTDNITGVTLPSFSGTAEVGATVTLFDGGNEIGSAVATGGTWHITTGSAWAMNERIHYITAIATDLAGNASTNSSALEVDVRTAGPATTVASMALSSDSGIDGDFITNTASQTVSGTLSANLASGERVQVSLNNGSTWTDAASTVGQSTWSLPVTLAAGSHDIQVRLIDTLDNFSTVLAQAYTLDAVKPSVTITSSAAQLMAGETATITFTFSEDPGASFSWDGSAGDLTVSGGTLSAVSGSGLTRTATFTPAAGTNGGTASIGVTADSYADIAGNLGTAGTPPAIAFDTLAPPKPAPPSGCSTATASPRSATPPPPAATGASPPAPWRTAATRSRRRPSTPPATPAPRPARSPSRSIPPSLPPWPPPRWQASAPATAACSATASPRS